MRLESPKHLRTFLLDLTKRKRTALTIDHYRRYLVRFMEVTGSTSTKTITTDSIQRFIRELREQSVGSKTINYHLTAIRSFLKWLPTSERSIEPREITLLNINRFRASIVDPQTISRALTGPSATRPSLAYVRDKALIEVIASTGIPLNTLSALRRSNIRTSAGKVSDRLPSGVSRLSHHARTSLHEYLSMRTDENPYVFIPIDRARTRRSVKPLTVRSIERIVRSYTKKNGVILTPRQLQAHARHR